MIGYFTKEGDVDVGAPFNPYLQSFKRIMKMKVAHKKYGTGLDLILIQYHLEGKYLELPAKMYKVMPYRKKEHSISVIVGVPQSFKDLSDIAKRQFIIDTTVESARLVREKTIRLGFAKINFEMLLRDIVDCTKEYLGLKTII
jgi:hypothetical protein